MTHNNKNINYLVMICTVASLGGLLFGFDTAVISGTVGMVETQFGLSKLDLGWFASSALVGCILGAVIAGGLGDKYGRRPVLLAAAVFFFLSAMGCALSSSFTFLVGVRILGGVGVGIASVISPLYISEFSPPHIRGRLVALYQLSIVSGILLAYFSNWMLQHYATLHHGIPGKSEFYHVIFVDEVWRSMFGMEMLPAILLLILLLFVPESPRWLIKEGKNDQGKLILEKISGTRTAESEFKEIIQSLGNKKGELKELFKPGLRKALLLAIALSVFGQLTGINAVIYYGPEIR